MTVKCDTGNCDWEGEFSALQTHIDFCLVACPNQCHDEEGNALQVARRDLREHLTNLCLNREYICSSCRQRDIYVNRDAHHQSCFMQTVSCTNDECHKTMPRAGLKRHLADRCLYTEVTCKYIKLGCAVKMLRRDIEEHESDSPGHLRMSLDTVAKIQTQNEELRDKVQRISGNYQKHFTVSNYSRRNRCVTHIFYSHPGGYCMFARVTIEDSSATIGAYICLMSGEHDTGLKWPFIGDVTITLLNHRENQSHHKRTVHCTRDDDVRIGRSVGFSDFISHSALVNDIQYLENDKLCFRVSVEVEGHKSWLSEC